MAKYSREAMNNVSIFRWLKQLGHSDSEIVKLDIEDDDRLTIPELCDAYMAHFLHVVGCFSNTTWKKYVCFIHSLK